MSTTKAPVTTILMAGMLSGCISEAEADRNRMKRGDPLPMDEATSGSGTGDEGSSGPTSTGYAPFSRAWLPLPSGYGESDISEVRQGKFDVFNLPYNCEKGKVIFDLPTGVETRISVAFKDGTALELDLTLHADECRINELKMDGGVLQVNCY